MDIQSAKLLIKKVFGSAYDEENLRSLVRSIFEKVEFLQEKPMVGAYIKTAFQDHILSYKRIAKYHDNDGKSVDVLSVCVKSTTKLEHARTMQRNFISWYLNGGRGGKLKDAALVAFYSHENSNPDWRFSLVRMDYSYDETKNKISRDFTPARRFSFLVGESEQIHTACKQFLPLMISGGNPNLELLEEAFNIETVSDEFFEKYKELFLRLVDAVDAIRAKDTHINSDFILRSLTTSLFCKKLLGQVVFLYFLQRKGWLGVPQNKNWGEGDKHFLRTIFEKANAKGLNYFNDYLEHFFYGALAVKRDGDYFKLFDCKIPFLNGGLFEPANGYDWESFDILIPNEVFSNKNKTPEGDTGDGILDIFDRYNFTVREDEALEKEVAVDPEMLGKVFENLLEVNDRKSKGAFYTPREIVHYMCQESLINYLYNKLNTVEESIIKERQTDLFGTEDKQKVLVSKVFKELVSKEALQNFIRYGDMFRQFENNKETHGDYQGNTSDEVLKYSETAKVIKRYSGEIDDALANVLICDPAIGSGAFPVGMMNEIVRARLNLLEAGYLPNKRERSAYSYKRHAIENSLYGVDIEDSAVVIAKLRFWLSLVVDENSSDEISPLPNLDYKIRCANSLVSIKKQGDFFTNLHVYLKELERYKDEFINTSDGRIKRGLKKKIDDLLSKIAKNDEFDYEIFFSEVFRLNRGFDIVIGNPPYVGEKGHKELFEPIKKCKLGRFYQGKMDLFYFFFHLALDLLKDDGTAAFITTNYYITATGGKKLREDLKKRSQILHLINFNELKIFKSATGQHNMITMLQKRSDFSRQQKCECCITSKTGFATPKELQDIVLGMDENTQYSQISQDKLYESNENYIRLQQDDNDSPIIAILNKIQTGNQQLSDVANVNQGIVSGADSVSKKHLEEYHIDSLKDDGIFVLNNDNPNDIPKLKQIQFSKNEYTLLKPFFKNSDINRYITSEYCKRFILFIGKDISDETQLNLRFPTVYEHLSKFKKIMVDKRLSLGEKIDQWFTLNRGTAHPSIFNGPKIVAPQRSTRNTFGYNEVPWYASADVYFITAPKEGYNLKYILGLLNSKLYYFWLYHKGKRKGETLELYQKPLSEIPIKKCSEATQQNIVDLVDEIIRNTKTGKDTSEQEKKLDNEIYDLYNISLDEQKIIESLQ